MKKENLKFGVFDIESNRWVKFEIMGFFDGREYREFTDRKKFLDTINHRRYRGYRFFAHNGGKFDFLFLLEEMLNRGWDCEMVPRQGSVIIIHVKTRKTDFHFSDSYALLPQSLKKLGEGFNTPHKKIEHDTSKRNSKRDPRLRAYLKNDCYCLFEVLTSFFANEYIIEPQFTIASQAMNTFRKVFLPCTLYRLALPDENLIRERFYSGGRVEVFKGYGRNIRGYDVNSLYPTAMREEMPEGEPKTVTTYQPGRIGFYKVHIANTPDWYISPLLHKVKKGNGSQNYYVNGAGDYFLSSATLDYIKSVWAIRFRVDYGIVFPQRKVFLQKYVDTFYDLKQKEPKDSALYWISKYFLNALYGKFGQMRFKEKITRRFKGMKDFIPFDDYFGLVLVEEESRSKFILPYIAAYITDLARLIHYKIMSEDEKNVFYCDTDSIFTSGCKLDKFIGKEIGKLSVVGDFTEAVFIAPKTYGLKEGRKTHITFKGFDPDEFTFPEFKKALTSGGLLSMKKERILSFTECTNLELNRERVKEGKGQPSKLNVIEEEGRYLKLVLSNKKVVSSYDKRIVYPSRTHVFDTHPFNYSDIQK